ncbi:hypothetical protein GYMLUDRAFT_151032, partial [Collybiopsis luxurians FD-317 M1]
LPKGRAHKLLPKFVGPYSVVGIIDGKSVYELGLPTELARHGIHNKFHILLLHPHVPNDDVLFPERMLAFDEITGHQWEGKELFFHVLWSDGDLTVEPFSNCQDLQALDRYLELKGVRSWWKLPRRG